MVSIRIYGMEGWAGWVDCGLRRNDEGGDAGGWPPYGPPAVRGDGLSPRAPAHTTLRPAAGQGDGLFPEGKVGCAAAGSRRTT